MPPMDSASQVEQSDHRSSSPSSETAEKILIRNPRLDEGRELARLIADCPPLDLNSIYAYFLVTNHYRMTSLVAEKDGRLVGAVTGYPLPEAPDILFIWQVAVHPDCRGIGLASQMLERLAGQHTKEGRRWSRIHTTIGPDNQPSRKLFARLATSLKAEAHFESFLPAGVCGEGHDAEDLLIIGPIPADTRNGVRT